MPRTISMSFPDSYDDTYQRIQTLIREKRIPFSALIRQCIDCSMIHPHSPVYDKRKLDEIFPILERTYYADMEVKNAGADDFQEERAEHD